MSIGNRGVLAAFAGLAALFIACGTGAYFGALYGSDHKQYEAISEGERSSGTYQGATQSLREIAGIPEPIERAIANPRSYGGEDRNERDLIAQEGMAVWGFWMAVAALGTMVITFFGTALIWKQVSLTREAVKDTGDATAAMIRQNELAEVSARPWLTLEMLHGFAHHREDQPGILFFSDLKITNIGGTPAQNVTVHTADVPDVIRNEFTDLVIISENMENEFSQLENMIVFPGSTETQQAIFLAPYIGRMVGEAAHPDILIIVNYHLSNGQAAQTTARFMSCHGDDRSEIFRGEPIPEDLRFNRTGYIRVT